MSDQVTDELVTFNGLNLATGGYFDEPITLGQFTATAAKYGLPREQQQQADLKDKKDRAEADLSVPPEYGLGDDLKRVGWGMIFPAAADPAQVDAILKAMKVLVDLRQEKAGKNFKICRDTTGYAWKNGRPETKNEFIAHFKLGPGDFAPWKLPFYLLIVADPLSIPFSFQHELNVTYAVGRIYFPKLQDYSIYAESVVAAEKGQVQLPRRAVFFGVANQDDKTTALSAENLIKPLYTHVANKSAEMELGWESILVNPEDALKENLRSLLGGDQTPAILFSATHGAAWPYNHENQLSYQGALVCQDWRRNDPFEPPNIAHALSAHEIPDTANLLGSLVIPFACFGVGTPYKDEFAIARNLPSDRLAPRPFLSALPLRLLSHPNGGGLGVIGHVERAWPQSFSWGDQQSTTGAFESLLTNLMLGRPVGLALDRVNMRYAEISVSLLNDLNQLKQNPKYIPPKQLAYEWTAANDARGYALLGDPAARLSLAPAAAIEDVRPSIQLTTPVPGNLPPVFLDQALQALDETEQKIVAEQAKVLSDSTGSQ